MTVSRLIRPLCAGLLGVVATLLVACGSSGKGLIPRANAGPLQSDFEAVAQAAQSGEGSCTTTKAAIAKTEQDFAALPAPVDPGLRKTLSQGISNLRRRALKLCEQPLPQATSSISTPTTTTQTQSTTTTPTTTQPTTATTTSPTIPSQEGGTRGPSENEVSPGAANSGQGGGTSAGESGAGGAAAGGDNGNGNGGNNGVGNGGRGGH
jgi:hypothetical protein